MSTSGLVFAKASYTRSLRISFKPLEEHLLWCSKCVERAEESADYVDALRAAIIVGNFDLE